MKRHLGFDRAKGFTIVELAVIIAVIGILAGVSYVGYGGWRERVATDVLKSDLTNAASQLESDLQWGNQYPQNEAAANGGAGLPKSEGTTYQYERTGAQSYCLTARSNIEGVPAFHIDSSGSIVREGACP